MIRLLFFITVCFFVLSCSYYSAKENINNPDQIRTVGIYDSLPWFSNTAEHEEDNIFFYPPQEPRLISFYKHYRLYRIATHNNWSVMHPVNDSVMENRTFKKDTTYYYYARQDTDPVVYYFNSLVDPVFTKMSADSLYRRDSDYKEPCIEEEKLSIYTQKAGNYMDGDLVTEIYIGIPNRPENYPDTTIFVFSKNQFWDSIPFTFSYSADASRKMKLIKFRLSSNGDPGSKYITMRKPRMIASEMKEVHPANEKELLNAFLAFEKFLTKNDK